MDVGQEGPDVSFYVQGEMGRRFKSADDALKVYQHVAGRFVV